MSISNELSGLVTGSSKATPQPAPERNRLNLVDGVIAGVCFGAFILAGSGNIWLSLNFGLAMFLLIGNILRFDDGALGLTSGFLAAVCASGVIGSFFGAEVGKVTALGLFAAVAPAIQLMDTEPGWGRGGRNLLAACWAIAATAIFLAWFFDNYSLRFVG